MVGLLLALSLRLVPNPPSLDIFGPGPFTNLGNGDELALTNAAAHVWFGGACTLALSHWVTGSPWSAGGICGAGVLVRETFFHGRTPGPEVRTDLLTGLGSILITAALDAMWRSKFSNP